tara:strand:+ start:28630 stop:31575 length:2946 start_codon:yes stop_codon:yes gene_type:complete
MSLVRVTKDLIENNSLVTHPQRSFVSSSADNILSGSVDHVARPSTYTKPTTLEYADMAELTSAFIEDKSYSDVGEITAAIVLASASAEDSDVSYDLYGALDSYMNDVVNQRNMVVKNQKRYDIKRLGPQAYITSQPELSGSTWLKHFWLRDSIAQSRASTTPSHNYAYFNYHSLNFFTASNIASGSALLFPNFNVRATAAGTIAESVNIADSQLGGSGDTVVVPAYGPYSPTGSVSFEFYINPRYTTTARDHEFQAGTIMHLSSTYAISLVTGSSKDENGLPDGYRILLQLSHSADIPPSKIGAISVVDGTDICDVVNNRKHPEDLMFFSSDNSLKRNKWHYVSIRWDTNTNAGSGSFVIDGSTDSSFNVTASMISPVNYGLTKDQPTILSIGNFYEGLNKDQDGTATRHFFNNSTAKHEGTFLTGSKIGGTLRNTDPHSFTFRHPLNADIHEVKIYNKYRSEVEIAESMKAGPSNLSDLMFYMPVLFENKTRYRDFIRAAHCDAAEWSTYAARKHDGTPDATLNLRMHTGSDTPFNTFLAQQVLGHSIEVEHFTRDFAQSEWPRLLHLTGTGNTRRLQGTLVRAEDGPMSYRNAPEHYGFSGWETYEYRVNLWKSWGDASDMLYYTPTYSPTNIRKLASKTMRKRNLLVMPCDNGAFKHNFMLLATGSDDLQYLSGARPPKSHKLGRYVDDAGNLDLSIISLRNTIDETFFGDFTRNTGTPEAEFQAISGAWTLTSNTARSYWPSPFFTITKSGAEDDGVILRTEQLVDTIDGGSVSENVAVADGTAHGNKLPLYLETGDQDSPLFTLFDIPAMYYGQNIEPGSVELIDNHFTGSQGIMSIRLLDDGQGGLYRADCDGPHATWNSVGTIYYHQGMIQIKSPHLFNFGKKGYTINFKGEQAVHVLTINVPCGAMEFTKSYNPTFIETEPSTFASETATEFVYLTGVEFHDDNLNVVMRATLAQPVVKRNIDEFLFKVKMDF